MKNQAFTRQDKIVVGLLSLMAVTAFFCNLGLNNIWTPNESFYAEAIREMWESGNFIEVFYNYEPRFNKPIMIYWEVLLSTAIFGLNEFAIRFPSALAGLGTIFLVYRIGQFLEGRRLGIVAAIIMTFAFQFAINARYAAPAISLTFFFTLTVYWFLKGYHREQFKYILLSYIALGVTILTKGYPYLIIIGAIIAFYILLDQRFRWKDFFKKLVFLRLYIGLPISIIIGMTWIIYMYATYGQEFWDIFMMETFERAFTRENEGLKPFFYLEANIWGFLPYSLTFYFGLIYLLVQRFKGFFENKALVLGAAWFLVMLVIFTASKGKIPTYFIQGYPGMSLFTAYFVMKMGGFPKGWKTLFQVSFWLPGALFVIGGVAIIFTFPASYLLLLLAVLPIILLIIGYRKDIEWLQSLSFPFTGFACMYIIFSLVVFPFVEEGYRNHDKIGEAILEQVPDQSIPLMAEYFVTWNLPYYAKRKAYDNLSPEQIKEKTKDGPLLALVAASNASDYGEVEVLWEGLLYTGSESRTLELILDVMKERRGEPTRFQSFCIIYRPEE
jgi:4-amino-4-deoxy-L-arabinose transferase-like glycosyltransferase